jgi:Sulfotransferase family
MVEGHHLFSHVLFSGGTGRSGTTIVGRLLSRHSKVTMAKPAEIKFLTAGNGILDLSQRRRVGKYKRLIFNDRLHLERFKYRLFHDWWQRDSKFGGSAGLFQGISEEQLKEIYSHLKRNFDLDIKKASQSFMRDYIEIQLQNARKDLWIDTTPVNIFRSSEIQQLLPGCRFIHMVRDGRDVISSAIREKWGPTNYEDGLIWYRRRMIRNLKNGITLKDCTITLSLEDLVINNRQESLEKLLGFLGIEEERNFREFFDKMMLASSINQGRWKSEVEDIGKFNMAYADLVDEFRDIDPSLPL